MALAMEPIEMVDAYFSLKLLRHFESIVDGPT
jgi:hypothetical protein